ncbi:conserved hypothetical protein (plasmid) [Borreliella burgdorferi 72a]|nr:conserved hypothetical protein [Borreliella burgdorferi 72a]
MILFFTLTMNMKKFFILNKEIGIGNCNLLFYLYFFKNINKI